MCKIAYYKIGNTWYLDAPEYLETPGSLPEDLERSDSFHDFLEMLCVNKDNVHFTMSTSPFEGADSLVLTGDTGEGSGAYYYADTVSMKKIDMELWFNQCLYHFCSTLPSKIFIKQFV